MHGSASKFESSRWEIAVYSMFTPLTAETRRSMNLRLTCATKLSNNMHAPIPDCIGCALNGHDCQQKNTTHHNVAFSSIDIDSNIRCFNKLEGIRFGYLQQSSWERLSPQKAQRSDWVK